MPGLGAGAPCCHWSVGHVSQSRDDRCSAGQSARLADGITGSAVSGTSAERVASRAHHNATDSLPQARNPGLSRSAVRLGRIAGGTADRDPRHCPVRGRAPRPGDARVARGAGRAHGRGAVQGRLRAAFARGPDRRHRGLSLHAARGAVGEPGAAPGGERARAARRGLAVRGRQRCPGSNASCAIRCSGRSDCSASLICW